MMETSVCFVILSILVTTAVSSIYEVRHAVRCTETHFDILVKKSEDIAEIQPLVSSNLPDCPTSEERGLTRFSVDINDPLQTALCAVTSIRNQMTDQMVFYQKLHVVYVNGEKRTLDIKCRTSRHEPSTVHNLVRRSPQKDDLWPEGFQEPKVLDITSEVVGRAPEPQLSVQVKQDGEVVGSTLDVRPDSLLTMEVWLDEKSAPTYGIIVDSMVASDTGPNVQEIMENGCSTQPQLFGSFNTTNGDYLIAAFKPFKFPTSNFVLFKGIVDVCINRCEGVQCVNGEVSYGRRRRRSLTSGQVNSVFQVTTSMLIGVKYVRQLLPQKTESRGIEFDEPIAVGYVKQVRSFTSVDPQNDGELNFSGATSFLTELKIIVPSLALVMIFQ